MESERGIGSTLGIVSIILIILGVVMAVVGLILLVVNQNSTKGQPWYVWFLLITGLLIAIIGGIMLAFALRDSTTECYREYEIQETGETGGQQEPITKRKKPTTVKRITSSSPSPSSLSSSSLSSSSLSSSTSVRRKVTSPKSSERIVSSPGRQKVVLSQGDIEEGQVLKVRSPNGKTTTVRVISSPRST